MILLFLLIFLFLALLLQKPLLTRSLEGLSEDFGPDRNVADPNEPIVLHVTLTNNSRHFIPFVKVRLSFPAGSYPGANPGKITRTFALKAHRKASFSLSFSISERGYYFLPRPRIYSGDFLGLSEQVQESELTRAVVIAPREAENAPELDVLLCSFLGDISVRRFLFDDPVLTAGYREYTGREPMKMISWKQSARGNGLMVKNQDYTVEPMVCVLLNTETPAPHGTRELLLEKAFSLARTVCRTLEEKGVKYSFSTNASFYGVPWGHTDVEEGLGAQHFQAVLTVLGRASYTNDFSCERLLSRIKRDSMSPQGILFLTPQKNDLTPELITSLEKLSDGLYRTLYPGKEADQ